MTIEEFTAALNTHVAALHRAMGSTLAPPTITTEPGKRYARIVYTTNGARSSYGFVDMQSGDILKSDGWKKPAKHARGNINSEKPLSCCGPYGIAYLR